MQHRGHCDGFAWSRLSSSGGRPGQQRLCGHARRIRYGGGLAESRPVLVNAAELVGVGSAGVKTKPSVVR